ncbi:MAG: hypothetical protein WCP85_04790 [Mariniphaga sp.]
MNIFELNQKYKNGELSGQTGDPELRRQEFSQLFMNLYENKVVYHERITRIIKLDKIELLPDRFNAIAIPYLLIEKGNRLDESYRHKSFELGASWKYLRLDGIVLSPYSSWLMWCDPNLVKQVEMLVLEKNFKKALDLTLNAM